MQRCLYPLFQNQSPHFLLSSLFWKLSQPLGQDQQDNKQTYCRLSITIFLWLPKRFISPESFLVYSTIVVEKFQIYSVKTASVSQKLNLFNFTHAPKQNSPPGFYHYPPGWRKLPIPPEQHFLKIFFPEQKVGAEDYVLEKITKINKGIGHKFW